MNDKLITDHPVAHQFRTQIVDGSFEPEIYLYDFSGRRDMGVNVSERYIRLRDRLIVRVNCSPRLRNADHAFNLMASFGCHWPITPRS